MPNLISILNSGESLEKAIVLTKLALESNPSFYSNYKKITIFYCENLPKKEKKFETHGTLGGLIKNLRDKSYLRYHSLEELWKDKDRILNIIYNIGGISERMRNKLKTDKKRFNDIAFNLLWYPILDNFKEVLVKKINTKENINLEFLNFRELLEDIFNDTNKQYYNNMRAQVLNPDGSTSLLNFLEEKNDLINLKENKGKLDSLKRSIILSPNVFMFILGMYYSQYKKDENLLFGFREFNRLVSIKEKFSKNLDGRFLVSSKRPSYDLAIDFLKKQNSTKLIIEPKNKLFGDLLNEIDIKQGYVSTERKTNLAIYNYLNNFL